MSENSDRLTLESRVTHLEELFAHQENLVHQLNEVITKLQSNLRQLEQRQALQEERLKWIGENSSLGDDLPHEKPPHY